MSNVKTKIMGIINITPDSFSDTQNLNNIKFFDENSTNQENNFEIFLNQFESMVRAGASIIDIGAESTRPDATPLTVEQEWGRLEPYIEILAAKKKLEGTLGVEISIDSYHPQTIKNCIKNGVIDYVNDVSGFKNQAMIDAIKNTNLQIIFMHSLTVPADKNITISGTEDEIEILKRFATSKIAELEKNGISRERLIFDIGLGFGKTPRQSYNIVKNISMFRNLGVRLLVGHSEKSFLTIFTNKPAGERGLETAFFSSYLAAQNVDIIRVHDVALNKRAIKLKDIFK